MLSFRRIGSGARTILLLHGFLASNRCLTAVARAWTALDDDISLILPDLPGHGGSNAMGAMADLRTVAHEILALANGLALQPPLAIAGHSLGGKIALQARLIDPETVGAIALLDIGPSPVQVAVAPTLLAALNAAPRSTPDRNTMLRHLETLGLNPRLSAWLIANGASSSAGFHWRIDREQLTNFFNRTRETDLWPAVALDNAYTRVVRGACSAHVSAEDILRLRTLGVTIETVSDADHHLHVQQPRAVARALSRAFAEVPRIARRR